MPEYTEAELITGCVKNVRAVQEYLYRQRYEWLLKICARYTGTLEDAEQLVQDAFLKIFANIGRFRNEGSFEGWMRQIAVRCCLDFLKSSAQAHMQLHVAGDIDEAQMSYADNNGLQRLSFQELLLLIQTLPQMTRTVFNLYVFEGMPHREIAQELACSEKTSAWHVYHARKLMQAKITELDKHKPYAGKRI